MQRLLEDKTAHGTHTRTQHTPTPTSSQHPSPDLPTADLPTASTDMHSPPALGLPTTTAAQASRGLATAAQDQGTETQVPLDQPVQATACAEGTDALTVGTQDLVQSKAEHHRDTGGQARSMHAQTETHAVCQQAVTGVVRKTYRCVTAYAHGPPALGRLVHWALLEQRIPGK